MSRDNFTKIPAAASFVPAPSGSAYSTVKQRLNAGGNDNADTTHNYSNKREKLASVRKRSRTTSGDDTDDAAKLVRCMCRCDS